MQFRLKEINTRFVLPIIHPTTGAEVSAETLYNDCCDALGYVVRDNIGDLVFDNFNYSADESACSTDDKNNALHDAVYAWAKNVRDQLSRAADDGRDFPISQPDPNRQRPAIGTRGQLSGRTLVMTKDGWRYA